MTPTRQQLRRDLRRHRRQLSHRERVHAAHAALARLRTLLRLRPGMRLGVYLSTGGELDTGPLIALALRRGCQLYVPVVHRERCALRFVPLAPPFINNRYGIAEPLNRAHRYLNPRRLDAVIVPLVAFGPRGERLGQGAGFYDQTFAFLRHRRAWSKPQFIGFAYDWQGLDALESEVWDVPLTAIATDRRAMRFKR